MSIDLDSLSSAYLAERNNARELVKKNHADYLSVLHAVPLGKSRVQKTANKPKNPTRKADQPRPFTPSPESRLSSTIGNIGHLNATSSVTGAPAVTGKPSGIDAVFAAINALTAAVTTITIPKASTVNMDAVLRASRAEDGAQAWNDGRSAAQRQGFTYHTAKTENSNVSLGKSAHAVRMNGNKFAPAPTPTTVKKADTKRFNDTYMQRRG